VVPLSQIATDPNHATNRAKRTYNASKLGLGPAVSAEALAPAINGVRREFYAEAGIRAAAQEGDIRFMAPCGYKARPLIGIWVTPPFLHNGSEAANSIRSTSDILRTLVLEELARMLISDHPFPPCSIRIETCIIHTCKEYAGAQLRSARCCSSRPA
jgi:hypothetical protein